MIRFPLLSLVALLLTGCGAAVVSSTAPASTPQQWSGSQSGVDEPSTRVIRDEATWTTLWQQLGREAPPVPTWNTHMAVGVFLGQRRTGGYRIEVVDAREESGRLVITTREHSPAPDKMVPQVLTSPWVVVIVPASKLPVVTQPVAPDR